MSSTSEPVLPSSRTPVPGPSNTAAEAADARREAAARALPTTAPELERELARVRDRLAADIDALTERVAPKNVAARAKANARTKVDNLTTSARRQVTYPDGSLRTEVVGAIAGAAVVVVVLVVLSRRRRS